MPTDSTPLAHPLTCPRHRWPDAQRALVAGKIPHNAYASDDARSITIHTTAKGAARLEAICTPAPLNAPRWEPRKPTKRRQPTDDLERAFTRARQERAAQLARMEQDAA